jgi:hypothetical protein
MSKAGDIAKVSAKGGFNYLWGMVLSTVISAVGTIFIARLLGSDLYGLYVIVFTAPTLFAIFRDWGVNSADPLHCSVPSRRQITRGPKHFLFFVQPQQEKIAASFKQTNKKDVFRKSSINYFITLLMSVKQSRSLSKE